VSLQGNMVRFTPVRLTDSGQMRVTRLYDKSQYKPTVSTLSVPRPKGVMRQDGTFQVASFGGDPMRDQGLLAWATTLLEAVVPAPVPAH
jgi:transcription-repair coupling factor (superfamily II helicase)